MKTTSTHLRWSVRFAFTLLALLPLTLASERVDPAEEAYQTIRQAFERREDERLLAEIDSFRTAHPGSNRLSSIALLAAQASLQTRDLDRARAECRRLTLQFPESGYLDDARLIEAEVELLAGRFDDAERLLGWVIGFAADRTLAEKARTRLGELNAWREAETLRSGKSSPPPRDTLRVGLILPLSGNDAEVSAGFLRGFLWRHNTGSSVEPFVWDSEGDPVRAVRLMQRTSREGRVGLFVGGSAGDETTALAVAAEQAGIPFLAALSPDEGMAAIGPNVFQGRIDYGAIGHRLGWHAAESEGHRTFAIIAPITRPGRTTASAFRETVSNAGGRVVASETYYPGAIDFSHQLNRIRQAGLRLAFNDSLQAIYDENGIIYWDGLPLVPAREQLIEQDDDVEGSGAMTPRRLRLSPAFCDSLWKLADQKALRWMESTGREIDSLAIPVTSIDAILMIVEPTSIEILAAQYARQNILAQLYGDENWADREKLMRVQRYVDGLIYAEPFPAAGGEKYESFTVQMTDAGRSGRLNRHHLAGERAARVARESLEGARSPADVRRALGLMRDVQTYSGPVGLLRDERVNKHLGLIRLYRGQIEPLVWESR